MSSSNINLRPVNESGPSRRSVPTKSDLRPWIFEYSPSPNGNDLNLLILFHGLGDNCVSFAKLGKSLNLPNTAVLSLQAQLPIPFMETPDHFSWYNTFDPMFNPLPSPDPSPALKPLSQVIFKLVSHLGWSLTDIHLLGWGQGGTMALELGLYIGKEGITIEGEKRKRLGSITSICGQLLSFPSANIDVATPIAIFTRLHPASAAGKKEVTSVQRAFKEVEVVYGKNGSGIDMPKGKEEWTGLMAFWGRMLAKDDGWKSGGDVFEVVR